MRARAFLASVAVAMLVAAFSLGSRSARAADDEDLAKRILAARRRTVKALGKAKIPPNARTLAALTLLRAGDADDRKVARRLLDEWWREARTANGSGTTTYEVALGIMAFEGLRLFPIVEKHPTTISRFEARPLPADVREPLEIATRALLRGRITSNEGAWAWAYGVSALTSETTTDPGPEAAWGLQPDNSNSQFAVLALESARRAGFALPAATGRAVGDYWVASRQKVAGRTLWGYKHDGEAVVETERSLAEAHASMFFAGLSSLAVAREIGGGEQRLGEAISAATKILPEFVWCFDRPLATEACGGLGQSYTLYAMEKALDLLEIKELAARPDLGDGGRGVPKREWFPPIAERVLELQGHDGLFSGDVIDSCLYVLFLSRATVTPARIVEAPAPRASPSPSPSPTGRPTTTSR